MAGRIDEGSDELVEAHEINVTPFIDVMLVLLIIFMVAAPLSTVDVHVDLPASTARPQPRPEKPLYLTIKSDLSLNIGNECAISTVNGSTEARNCRYAKRSICRGTLCGSSGISPSVRRHSDVFWNALRRSSATFARLPT